MPRIVHRAELSSQRLSHRCTDIGAFQFCTQQRQGRGCAGQLVGIEEITQQGSELFVNVCAAAWISVRPASVNCIEPSVGV